ncbi:hypothetical protein V3C99_015828, partial [Haemonchus contortus]
CSEFPYTRKCRRESGVPSSVNERRSGMPLTTPRNRRSGEMVRLLHESSERKEC